MRTVDTFRPETGNKFSSYLGRCLIKNLPSKLRDMKHTNVIHVPKGKYKRYLTLEERAFQQRKGFEEVCNEQGLSKNEIKMLIAARNARVVYSCEDMIEYRGKPMEFISTLEDKSQSIPQGELMKGEEREQVFDAIDKVLTQRERRIVLSYYFGKMTLLDMGKKVGLTKEGVRLIKKRALQKL